MNAHGANTTYQLSAGTYQISNPGNNPALQVQSNCQVIGVNPDMNTDNTVIQVTGWTGGWGVFDDTSGGNSSGFQLWGCTLDMNGSASGFGRGTQLVNGGNSPMIQNCHFININSSVATQERFIILNTGQTIDNCRFGFSGQGSDVNNGGYTVIAGGTVSNCVFDTIPSVVAYFHCIGDPCTVTNSTWTAPGSGYGAFIYGEPGNGVDSGTPKSTASGCTVNLNNNSNYAFSNIQPHTNMTTNWWGGIDITGNTISNGTVFSVTPQGNLAGPPPEVVEVTIQHNTLTNCTLTTGTSGNNFGIGTLTTSPNP